MTRALLVFIVAAATTVTAANAQSACTHETLTVQGTPVSFDYCVTGRPRTNEAQEVVVPVAATYAAAHGTLRRSSELRFMGGEGVSRVLEDLDLTKLGLTGVLHLTLAYSHGVVRVEGALLTPGAITVK